MKLMLLIISKKCLLWLTRLILLRRLWTSLSFSGSAFVGVVVGLWMFNHDTTFVTCLSKFRINRSLHMQIMANLKRVAVTQYVLKWKFALVVYYDVHFRPKMKNKNTILFFIFFVGIDINRDPTLEVKFMKSFKVNLNWKLIPSSIIQPNVSILLKI